MSDISDLEQRIVMEYTKASLEMGEKLAAYFAAFARKDKKRLEQVRKGEISHSDYIYWRLGQMAQGRRFEKLREELADRIEQADEIAAAYINDDMPRIYAQNKNYQAWLIETTMGSDDIDLTIINEEALRILIKDQPDIMPYYPPQRAIERGFDLEFGKKQITKQMTTALMMGDSIPKIQKRLQKNIPTMSKNSAIRAARTAATAAANGGTLNTYIEARDKGVKIRKQWLATLDGRTRHSHGKIDGEIAEVGKKFSNGCICPGDPDGAPGEVYNCRCTMVSVLDGIDNRGPRIARDPVTGKTEYTESQTYTEWLRGKERAK